MAEDGEYKTVTSRRPIFQATHQCAQDFERVLSAPQTARSEVYIPLSNQRDRLKIWAGSMGVVSELSSADRRLEKDSNVVDVIVMILKRLSAILQEISEHSGNYTQHAAHLPKAQMLGDSRTEDEVDDSESSSASSSSNHGEQVKQDEMASMSRLETIEHNISNLYRLSAMLKKSNPTKETQRIERFAQEKVDSEDSDGLERFARWQIHRLFPAAAGFLVERLVRAVSFQRARILYRQQHYQKKSEGLEEAFHPTKFEDMQFRHTVADSQQDVTSQIREGAEITTSTHRAHHQMALSNTEASSVNQHNEPLYPKSVAASRVTQSAVVRRSRLDIPPAPKPAQGMREGPCPYCSQIIKRDVFEEPRWTRHVIKDLEPYVCIFEECDLLRPYFKDASPWMQHMRQHRRLWTCKANIHPPATFKSASEFIEHMRNSHPQNLTNLQLSQLAESSIQPASNPFQIPIQQASTEEEEDAGLCVFCPFSKEEALDVLKKMTNTRPVAEPRSLLDVLHDHVKSHLEQIALLALPELPAQSGIEELISNENTLSEAERLSNQNDEDMPPAWTTGSQEEQKVGTESMPTNTDINNVDEEVVPSFSVSLSSIAVDWQPIFSKMKCNVEREYSGHEADPNLEKFVGRYARERLSLDMKHSASGEQGDETLQEARHMVSLLLRFENMYRREETISSAHPATFRWVFDEGQDDSPNEILNWLRQGQGVFLVQGKPGSGKSTFMKFLASDGRTRSALRNWAQDDELILVFSAANAGGSVLASCPDGFLRKIFYGLLQLSPVSHYRNMVHELAKHGGDDYNLPVLKLAFIALQKDCRLQRTRICLFIDAVNEMDDFNELLIILHDSFEGIHLTHIKVCLSSRPHAAVLHSLRFFPMLVLQNHTSEDISNYVRSSLLDMQADRETIEKLVEEIHWRASGVFLLARLLVKHIVDIIRSGGTREEIFAGLAYIPEELKNMWELMYQSIDRQYLTASEKILRIVAASRQGFSLMEIYFAFHRSHPAYTLKILNGSVAMQWMEDRSNELLELKQHRKGNPLPAVIIQRESPISIAELTSRVSFTHHTIPESLLPILTEAADFDASNFMLISLMSQFRAFQEIRVPGHDQAYERLVMRFGAAYKEAKRQTRSATYTLVRFRDYLLSDEVLEIRKYFHSIASHLPDIDRKEVPAYVE